MTRKELQKYLNDFPENMPVKFIWDWNKPSLFLSDENIIIRTDTVYVNPDAPEEEHDHEDGKIELGNGERFILINAPIL